MTSLYDRSSDNTVAAIKKKHKKTKKSAKYSKKVLDSMSVLVYNVSINNEKGYIMKKIIFICLVLWFGLNAFAKTAQADDYNTAVVAHVIKENISGNGVDMSVLEAEMAKLAYKFSLEMTSVVEKHLPLLLESIAKELQMKADEMYKEEIGGKS